MPDAARRGDRPGRRWLGNVLLLAGSAAASLILMEAALALLGYEAALRRPGPIPPQVRWWENDPVLGARYIPGRFPDWPTNNQGYGDTDDFDAPPTHEGPRVLVLGDSFTFGVRASSYQTSYVSVMEAALRREPPVLAWNAAIPGSGQRQDVQMVRTFGPMLQPDIVVLGFYLNDFWENQFPKGLHYVFEDHSWVVRYAMAPGGTYMTLSPEAAYRRAHDTAGLHEAHLSTRLGTLVESVVRRASGSPRLSTLPDGELHDHVLATTVELVRQVRDEAAALEAPLVALLIPQEGDLDVPSRHYRAARTMFENLGIPCCELLDTLTSDDYLPMPDGHWVDSGHRKAGEKLAAFIEPFLRGRPSS